MAAVSDNGGVSTHEFDVPVGEGWCSRPPPLGAHLRLVPAADAELLDRVRRFAQTPTAATEGAHSDVIRGFNAGESQTLKRLRELLGIEE